MQQEHITNDMRTAASAAMNTKIETVTEAVENLANAIVDARLGTKRQSGSTVLHSDVGLARAELAGAFRDFLAPRLFVLDGGRQAYPAGTVEADKPTCGKCGNTFCCKNALCDDWHAAIRTCVLQEKQGA